MKLTTEQKRYRKTVIFDNEIKLLQEKIDNLHLSKPLTIKKLYFDYNKAHDHRECCVKFKETFTVIRPFDKKKERINKWAAANIIYDGSGIIHNGLVISTTFCHSGCRYKDSDNDIEDDEIRKVCVMLANEYFLWIHWTDHTVFRIIDMQKRMAESNSKDVSEYLDRANHLCKFEMNRMWKRLDIAYEGIYTQYTLTEMIKKYNEQVERGLIIDSPFENGFFVFDEVEDMDIPDKYINECGLFG